MTMNLASGVLVGQQLLIDVIDDRLRVALIRSKSDPRAAQRKV